MSFDNQEYFQWKFNKQAIVTTMGDLDELKEEALALLRATDTDKFYLSIGSKKVLTDRPTFNKLPKRITYKQLINM